MERPIYIHKTIIKTNVIFFEVLWVSFLQLVLKIYLSIKQDVYQMFRFNSLVVKVGLCNHYKTDYRICEQNTLIGIK